jgi:hypothetical protein
MEMDDENYGRRRINSRDRVDFEKAFLQRLAESGPKVAYGVWLMQEQRTEQNRTA